MATPRADDSRHRSCPVTPQDTSRLRHPPWICRPPGRDRHRDSHSHITRVGHTGPRALTPTVAPVVRLGPLDDLRVSACPRHHRRHRHQRLDHLRCQRIVDFGRKTPWFLLTNQHPSAVIFLNTRIRMLSCRTTGLSDHSCPTEYERIVPRISTRRIDPPAKVTRIGATHLSLNRFSRLHRPHKNALSPAPSHRRRPGGRAKGSCSAGSLRWTHLLHE